MDTIKKVEVTHVNPSVIWRMEETMELILGYKVKIEDILMSPKNKDEEMLQRACVRALAWKTLQRNQKILWKRK